MSLTPPEFTVLQKHPPTDWFAIWALFLSGCTLALHIGKVPSALPLLRDELNLSLTQAGAVVSTYAVLVALFGLVFGLRVRAIGYVRFALLGLALGAIGSVLGMMSHSFITLIVSRAIEGAGWIFAVIALPSILSQLSSERDRPLVMGLWGAFVPIGAGSMLFIAPLLQSIDGWRLSWLVAGIASFVAVGTVWYVCRVHQQTLQVLVQSPTKPPLRDLQQPQSIALALCFFFYSFQYGAVTSFLPIALVDLSAMQLADAARLSAVVILLNALGNVAAGWLLRHGMSRHRLLSFAALCTGILACVVYIESTPLVLRIIAACGFSIVGGLIPGTVFATAPLIASTPAVVGVLIGFMLQSSGFGQTFGPLALPLAVEHFGSWTAAGVLMLVSGGIGSIVALGLKRLPDR